MKLRLRRSVDVAFLSSAYTIPAVVMWCLQQPYGIVLCVGIAYVVDRLYPRFATDVGWRDVSQALMRFKETGVVGARLHMIIDKKAAFLQLIEVRGQRTFSLQYHPGSWRSSLGDDFALKLLEEGLVSGVLPSVRWPVRILNRAYLAPENDRLIDSAILLLRRMAESRRAPARDLLFRVDYSYAHTKVLFGGEASDSTGHL